MKEQEIDEYLGKVVRVIDFENEIKDGKLYKVVNHIVQNYELKDYIVPTKDGYFLKALHGQSRGYCKSHIKRIERIMKEEELEEITKEMIKRGEISRYRFIYDENTFIEFYLTKEDFERILNAMQRGTKFLQLETEDIVLNLDRVVFIRKKKEGEK